MDVETEPIHFTQDVHHSVNRPAHPPKVPGLHRCYQQWRRQTKKGAVSLSHLFSDPGPNGAQLESSADDPSCVGLYIEPTHPEGQ